MTNNVTTFNFNSQPIRVVEIDGEPWFVAKDVLNGMGYPTSSHSKTVEKLDRSELILKQIQKGVRSVLLISESGLYKLVLRSDKPQAKAFQNWVAREVLPSIRKTGAYVVGQPSVQEDPERDPLELAAAQVEALQKVIAPGFTTKL